MDFDYLEHFIRESNAIEDVDTENMPEEQVEKAVEDSLDAWEVLEDVDELTHEVVKNVHYEIVKTLEPDKKPGEYRSEPDEKVWVGGEAKLHPTQVKRFMDLLLDDEPETHSEIVEWHKNFELIHPFLDGNGRTGRLIYYWQCIQNEIVPWTWQKENRQEYYKLFQNKTLLATAEELSFSGRIRTSNT